jgi:hypothetical protein
MRIGVEIEGTDGFAANRCVSFDSRCGRVRVVVSAASLSGSRLEVELIARFGGTSLIRLPGDPLGGPRNVYVENEALTED